MSAQIPVFNTGNPNFVQEGTAEYYAQGYLGANPNSAASRLTDFFGFTNTQADYDQWKTSQNQWYETQATQSARAWDEYMQSTQYQRMVKDLKAAGLNPWLALQGASLSGAHQTTAGSGSSARYSSSSREKSGVSTAVAAFLIACARVFAAVIAA